jgi:site-specific DNA recombinase
MATVGAIYTRVSSRNQEDGASLPTQERECLQHAEELGITIPDRYRFQDIHGGDVLDRPGLDALRSELRSGRLHTVIAYAVDRLSRDQIHLGVIVYEADRYDTRLEFVTEKLEDTPVGKMIRSNLAFAAEVELAKITERTQRGRRERARLGKLITGASPLYGYLWGDPEKGKHSRSYYVVDPETAPIVVRIFKSAAAGMTLAAIVRELEADHIPTPSQILARRGQLATGKSPSLIWQRSTVQKIFRNPMYTGRPVAYRSQVTLHKERDAITGLVRVTKRRSTRDEAEHITLPVETCPPLIDEVTARAVEQYLAINRAQSARNNHDPEATLLRGGFIKCGYCGANMYGFYRGERSGWLYTCRSRRMQHGEVVECPGGKFTITASIVDTKAWGYIQRELAAPHFIHDAVDQWREQNKPGSDKITANLEAMDGQLGRLRASTDNLSLAIGEASEGETRALLTKRLDEVNKQIRALEQVKRDLLIERPTTPTRRPALRVLSNGHGH